VQRYVCTICNAWAYALWTRTGRRPLRVYREQTAPLAAWFLLDDEDDEPEATQEAFDEELDRLEWSRAPEVTRARWLCRASA
jgi:hypothetical protein